MKTFISFAEALETTCSMIPVTDTESLNLEHLSGRVLASDLVARVNSPSVDASLKDGYAVRSSDLAAACKENPVPLHLSGHITAGVMGSKHLDSGKAIRITTGSPIPTGADAVLSEEFTTGSGETILCTNTAHTGRNILFKGTDIHKGDRVALKGDTITPAITGLIATAGLDSALVYKKPFICVIATGDEIVAPGLPLPEGKLYASNITAICAWLSHFGILWEVAYVGDTRKESMDAIRDRLSRVDGFITSGGIWGSEKDMMIRVLEELNWQGLYHRVRLGPGKAIAFGLLEKKPFFCLPGGPPSNEMAFLQIALPGLLRMKGETHSPFPLIQATLTSDVRGDSDWTQFFHALLEKDQGHLLVTPQMQKSRLQSMANKNALIVLPEGFKMLTAGSMITVQVLDTRILCNDMRKSIG
ncbi:MAG: molybdopterin molybdotransferase MoeA [Proteobacteria bacterium]|nr:molybdopterin molybdotransferase MoeA [Pseudomonadota bacterium]